MVLVSFYIIAYNHEKMIADAIKAALSQTYSPLQIIISDDCSTDGTWGVIQRIIESYQGRHSVISRRNDRNLGVAGHINEIWNVCRGEWIVASAGDDISCPNRVSRIMEIVTQRPRVKLVQSFLNEVDEEGSFVYLNRLGSDLERADISTFGLSERLGSTSYAPHGAAMAYCRELIDFFPRMPPEVIFEDNIVNLRAELLGEAVLIAEPLVNHTNHDGQITRVSRGALPADREKSRQRRLVSDVASTRQNIEDIHLAFECDKILQSVAQPLIALFLERYAYFKVKLKMLTEIWPRSLFSLTVMHARYGINKYSLFSRDDIFKALLPYMLYLILKKIRSH